jgi:hypothetical protein
MRGNRRCATVSSSTGRPRAIRPKPSPRPHPRVGSMASPASQPRGEAGHPHCARKLQPPPLQELAPVLR